MDFTVPIQGVGVQVIYENQKERETMKQLKCKAMLVLAVAGLWAWHLTPLAVVGVSTVGCSTTNGTNVTGDAVLKSAEKTAEISLAVIDGFVTIEQDNRAFLNTVSPEIEKASHKVQKEGMAAWEGLRKATATYKANRTPDNAVNIQTWIATLQVFRELAQKYADESVLAIAKARAANKPNTN